MRFCVRCGKDVEEVIDGLCTECFLDGRKLLSLPHHVDLQMCTNCGEFRIRNAWVPVSRPQAAEDVAIEHLSAIREAEVLEVAAEAEELDENNYLVHVRALLEVSDVTLDAEDETVVRVKNTVCKRCSRYLGNYYESIIQIRTRRKDLPPRLRREVLGRIDGQVAAQAKNNRNIFISKIEDVPGGVDVYLSSIQLGKAIAKVLSDAYSAESKEAFKLVGQTRDGQDMFRITYLVRLPDFHVGDIVRYAGGLHLLSRIFASGGRITALADFRDRNLKHTEMEGLEVVLGADELIDAVVVSRSETEIQILHPTTYETIDLVVPAGTPAAETAKVANIDGTIFFVPERM